MRPRSDGDPLPGGLAARSGRGLALFSLLISLILLGGCALWPRQDPVGRGQRLYQALCASSPCHGEQGDGVAGIRHFSKQFLDNITNERLFRTISEGNRVMVPFSKERGGQLSDQDIQDIISYMKARAGASQQERIAGGKQKTRAAEQPTQSRVEEPGAAGAGLAANATYAKYCVACHKTDGLGVSSAPLGYRGFVAGLGQDGLARGISQGKGEMPPWGESKGGPLSDSEIAGLAAHILSSASSAPPPTAAPRAQTAPTPSPTAAPSGIGTAAPAPDASGPPEKAAYDQFCVGCHPVPAAIASGASRESAMKYVPGLTQGQADIIIDYLRGLGAGSPVAPAATVRGSGTPAATARDNSTPDAGQSSSQPRTSTGGKPPDIPHNVQGREDLCLGCHGRGAMAPYPVGHTGRTVETCLLCHVASPKPAPPMPHALGDRAGRCLVCHGSGGGAHRVPSDHAGRTTDSCTFCH